MNINERCYDLEISTTYNFVEISEKVDGCDPFELLIKIKKILDDLLCYNSLSKDEFSNLTEMDLLKLLDQQSRKICESCLHIRTGLSSDQEEKIKQIYTAIHTRIENILNPPTIFPFPFSNELIQEFIKYLKISEIGSFARLNKHAKHHADVTLLNRAREFGYRGNDQLSASQYLKNLYKEMEVLWSRREERIERLSYTPLMMSYIVLGKNNAISVEATLNNLQKLKGIDFRNLFSELLFFRLNYTEKVHDYMYKHICTFLLKQLDFLIENGDLSPNSFFENRDLSIRVLSDTPIDFLKVLLKHKADLSLLKESPFLYLISYKPPSVKYVELIERIKLLLQYGVKLTNEHDGAKNYLPQVVNWAPYELVKLLLDNGADPNYGSPLTNAKQFEVAQLLVSYGAKGSVPNLEFDMLQLGQLHELSIGKI